MKNYVIFSLFCLVTSPALAIDVGNPFVNFFLNAPLRIMEGISEALPEKGTSKEKDEIDIPTEALTNLQSFSENKCNPRHLSTEGFKLLHDLLKGESTYGYTLTLEMSRVLFNTPGAFENLVESPAHSLYHETKLELAAILKNEANMSDFQVDINSAEMAAERAGEGIFTVSTSDNANTWICGTKHIAMAYKCLSLTAICSASQISPKISVVLQDTNELVKKYGKSNIYRTYRTYQTLPRGPIPSVNF